MPCLKLLLEVLHSEHLIIYEQHDAEFTLEGPLPTAYYHDAVLIHYG